MNAEATPVVHVSHLRKSFGEVQAVTDVSFEVFPGEIFGLLGPNGAGKTTTIRMMLDIFRPDGGEVQLFGGGMTEATKGRIGYLPEERGLYKDLKLEQTLLYLAQLKGLSRKEAQQRLTHWLRRFELYEHRTKKIKELSHGMQQKAQLIAALIHEPDLLVIDEPFAGLDPVNTRLVKTIIREQSEAGRAIIMSTHQLHQVEALCGRIALINAGQTVLYGELAEIKNRFAGHAVEVEGKGDFSTLSGIRAARQENGLWHLYLEPQQTPRDLLRQIAERDDLTVRRFEIAYPSLDDIFIAVVSGQQEVAHD